MELPLTIHETQEGLLNKDFRAVELVDGYFERINKYNQDLNVYLTVSEEQAYKAAKKVDKLLAGSSKNLLRDYPLLGATVAYKDLFSTKGVRTTAASKVLEDYIPAYSATFVLRAQSAGCIILGKTNCDAWAHGASGENSDFGSTKNPWNKKYVPGGSSSGSAAAVAANLALWSSGTDTGGSIRQPANFCGVYGLKPTYGAVSRYGIIAMASSLDSVGHFARCVDDVEKIFRVVVSEDGKDGTVKNPSVQKPKTKLRIGIPKEYFIEGIDEEVKQEVKAAAKLFEREGIEVVEISLPHTKYAISVYYIVQPAEVSSNLGRYDGIRFGHPRSAFGAEAKRRIMLGTYVLSAGYYEAYYLKAMKVRSKIIADFENVFNEVDAVIAPVSPTPAFKLGEKVSDPLQMYLADIFTVAGNLAGIPGLAIPNGYTKKGLPLGFQLLGPRFSETTLFNLGRLFEKMTNYSPKEAKLY